MASDSGVTRQTRLKPVTNDAAVVPTISTVRCALHQQARTKSAIRLFGLQPPTLGVQLVPRISTEGRSLLD